MPGLESETGRKYVEIVYDVRRIRDDGSPSNQMQWGALKIQD